TKSLEIIHRAVEGAWDPAGRTPVEVAGYIAAVARNEIMDWRQRAGRLVPLPDGEDPPMRADEVRSVSGGSGDSTDLPVERSEFAQAVIDCVGGLAPRSRRIWIFRTLFEMRSREIASHPEVGMEVGHVDVVFSRARRSLQDCLGRKGHSLDTMPRGV